MRSRVFAAAAEYEATGVSLASSEKGAKLEGSGGSLMRIGGSETGTAGYRGAQSGGDVKTREDWSESRLASVCLSLLRSTLL
jgi:hypothetical protein